MTLTPGIIVLMGSGELTATMVEVHKDLLARTAAAPQAAFLDTPAGFQLNVDQISERAVTYFRKNVGQPLSIASMKSLQTTTPMEAEQAYHTLREADYILIGPGSPTYAVRQLQETPVPEILIRRVEAGGCLVAASAAALTVGHFTLPVYEIYKVGEDPHWVEGMNILGRFGFNLVVIPHWNNAEGGNHDTRFCFMGEPRFNTLESLLPEDVFIFGLDEHTACIIDLGKEQGEVRGIGRVILRGRGREISFQKGDVFPLKILRGGAGDEGWSPSTTEKAVHQESGKGSFWERIHSLENAFQETLGQDDPKEATNALLELDRTVWRAQRDLESEETISQAREVLREFMVLLGNRLSALPANRAECLAPLVEEMIRLRAYFREKGQYETADAVRDSLHRTGIIIEDTRKGSRWRIEP